MSKAAKTATPRDFESALAELESLVNEMEAGQLPLDASLNAYKRGMELTLWCQKTLADAEHQVKVLEGQLLKDFTPDLPEPNPDE